MVGGYDVESCSEGNAAVIYLGCFPGHWGHFLVDFMPRLWYLLQNDQGQPLVYVTMKGDPIGGPYLELLELFGIDPARLICITAPTKFREVVVPQMSYQRPNIYFKEYRQIFECIVGNLRTTGIEFTPYEKIYWTRRKFRKARRTEIGEKEIEKLFEANGYKVLAPERMSVKEQVYYFSTCKHMAGVSGTIPHNLVFADKDTEFVILNRTYRINTIQFPITEMIGASVIYIDCHMTFLPNSPDKGPYWMKVNDNVKSFAKDRGFVVPKKIEKSGHRVKMLDFVKYCSLWFNIYTGNEPGSVDAGIAGKITGRTRPSIEGTEEHEIYYYYRGQLGNVYDWNQIIEAAKRFVKRKILKG